MLLFGNLLDNLLIKPPLETREIELRLSQWRAPILTSVSRGRDFLRVRVT